MEKFDITQLDGNLILHTGDYQYSNKPLKEWDCDDFAEYIKDSSYWSNDKMIITERNCLLYFLYDIHYLSYMPENYAQVYLYGVWQVLGEFMRGNAKHGGLDSKQKTLLKRRTTVWNKAQVKFRDDWRKLHAEALND